MIVMTIRYTFITFIIIIIIYSIVSVG